MLFEIIKWYAIAKGVYAATKKRKPMTLAQIDTILVNLYVDPIRQQLSQPCMLMVRFEDLPGEPTARVFA